MEALGEGTDKPSNSPTNQSDSSSSDDDGDSDSSESEEASEAKKFSNFLEKIKDGHKKEAEKRRLVIAQMAANVAFLMSQRSRSLEFLEIVHKSARGSFNPNNQEDALEFYSVLFAQLSEAERNSAAKH